MKSVIKLIIFSLILSIIINVIYFKYIDSSKIKQIFGYSCLKVLTGSMNPEIKAGENIIIKKCDKYEIGDVITYIAKSGELITHRIVSITDKFYYTKGDANNVCDPEPVLVNQIYGKVIFHFCSFFNSPFFSLAKNFNYNKASLKSEIANPIFIVDGDNEILIKQYDSISNYKFIVKNYNEDKVSDVSFTYNIDIIADDIVELQLYNNANLVDINSRFILPHSISTDHEYLLKIKAPEDYEGKVKINISACQMEEGMS